MSIKVIALGTCVSAVVFCSPLLADTDAPPSPAADSPSISKSSIEVVKAVLCAELKDHQPAAEVLEFKMGDVAIGWSQFRSAKSETSVTHRWMQNGQVALDVKLAIKSSPYRTWSRKTLAVPGPWTWEILDSQGEVLKSVPFTVQP